MSTAKRSRRRQTDPRSASPLPDAKRQKITESSHVPSKSGLKFLVDEDARSGKKLDARLTNGVPGKNTTRVDESNAVVARNFEDEDDEDSEDEEDNGDDEDDEAEEDEDEEYDSRLNGTVHEVIDISSVVDESSAYESGDQAEQMEVALKRANGHVGLADNDEEVVQGGADDDADAENDEEQDDAEADQEVPEDPSFGDMLLARHPDPIHVRDSFPDPMAEHMAMIPASSNTHLAVPSGSSLGTVLTQALKTNDRGMLENCFQVNDHNTIRSTLDRLHSRHVSTLIQRIAERIHRKPGRTGRLLIWVQHALIAHGAYLATQPNVMRKLKALSQVLRERASGLQPLFHLKGKLDVLSAQLELRKHMYAASRAANADDEDDEDAVLYVEGQEDNWSDDELDDREMRPQARMIERPASASKSKARAAEPESGDSDDGIDGSDDDLSNGVVQESEDENDDEEGEQDEEGLFDDEAEETDDDDGEELDSDEEADSEAEEDEEEENESSGDESEEIRGKQPHPATLNRKR